MRLSGKEVDVQDLVIGDEFSSLRVGIQAASQFWLQKIGEDDEGPLVPSSVEISE